jgi:ADP-ribosylglycohydrolase
VDKQVKPAANSPLRDRIRNALLHATCADRLAAPLDRLRLPSPPQIENAINAGSPAPASHLSEHLLLLAEHLIKHSGQLHEDNLACTLAQHPPAPTGGPDGATTSVLAQVAQGIPWWRAAPMLHQGQGSYGSAAAVRAVAAGMIGHGVGGIADLARRTAVITHTHPWARDGAAGTATAVALAIHGLPSHSFGADQFLAAVASQTHDREFGHYLSVARTLTRHRAGPAEAIATFDNGASVLRTVPAALTAFLRYPASPAAALRYALSLGGRTRAIATITAALSGARCPETGTTPGFPDTAPAMLRLHSIASGLAAIKVSPSGQSMVSRH